MTVVDPTMSYEGLVQAGRAAREQADNMQWVEGDLALQVEALSGNERPRDPDTGDFVKDEVQALQRYANDVDIPYATVRDYRAVAQAWHPSERSDGCSWAVHRVLYAQDDRASLLRPDMTYREAQKLVRARTAGNAGKPGWLELMGMAADKMLAAGRDLAKVEAAVEARGDAADIPFRMVEKADRFRAIAQDLADRFEAIGRVRDAE